MLAIPLNPSKILATLLGSMHGLCIALLWLLPVGNALKILLGTFLLGSLAFYLGRDYFFAFPQTIVAFRLEADCGCAFQTRRGDWVEASLLGTSFVSPYLAVLNLKPGNSRLARHIVLLPDSLEKEEFRQLRVLLRWKCNKH